jgi:hypothetical protein
MKNEIFYTPIEASILFRMMNLPPFLTKLRKTSLIRVDPVDAKPVSISKLINR